MNHDQFSLPFLDTTSLGDGLDLCERILRAEAWPEASADPRERRTVRDAHFQIDRAPPNSKIPHRPSPRRITGSPAIAALPRVGRRAQRTISPRSDLRPPSSPKAVTRAPTSRRSWRASPHSARRTSPIENLPSRQRRLCSPWEDLGVELEGLVSRDDLANLKRATQYAHYTPEFMIRAIWRKLCAKRVSTAGASSSPVAGRACSSPSPRKPSLASWR